MRTESLFPDWLGGRVVDDALFAAAYDAVPAPHRAWVKTTLARHAVLWTGGRNRERTVADMGSGWRFLRQDAPYAWILLLLPCTPVSPVKLAAALMPMLLAGVDCLTVAFVGQDAPPAPDTLPVAALAALELAGQEQVVTLSQAEADDLTQIMAMSGRSGLVAALDNQLLRHAVCGMDAGALRTWSPGVLPVYGVWGADVDWDWEALAFAHPDAAVTAWNAGKQRLPQGVQPRTGDFASFLGQSYGALFVPDAMLEEALAHAQVVMGPGHEGDWIWPELKPDFFRVRRVGFGGRP